MTISQLSGTSAQAIGLRQSLGGPAEQKPAKSGEAAPAAQGDSMLVSTGKGIARTFYGTVAGTGAGIVSFYTPIARPFANAGAPKIVAIPAMLSGVAAGVVAGNMVSSPGKAAGYGALGGAVLGAYFGYGAGSVATSISGALVGAVAGSVSGLVTAGVFPSK